MQQHTILTALFRHARCVGERIPQFREAIVSLSAEDREWFVQQLKREFDYEIVESTLFRPVQSNLPVLVLPKLLQQKPTHESGYIEL